MAYGANILVNSSAETQDTSGWTVTPAGSVTVAENQTSSTRYIPYPDSRDKWFNEEHILSLFGPAGDYCFSFSSIAQMEQILYASDVGTQPNSFQFIAKYKLLSAQELWDTNVLATINLTINYTDGTSDYFIIPCIKGATHKDRNLINFWIIVYNICTVNANKTLNYVKVIAKTINCNNILNIDYIELRKEV
jgi:hypothetical protein